MSGDGGLRRTKDEEEVHQRCVDHVREVLRSVNTVKYITDVMGALGREFTERHVKCIHSRGSQPGVNAQAGYMWASTPVASRGEIVIHEDAVMTREDVERALRHELVHAFDDARGFIEPTNCYHHACSEIRAARLSGDCFLGQEVKRGNLDFVFSGRNCVKRRAAMAVENSPLCRGFGSRAVDVTFQRCYTDYEPFVAPIYSMGNWIEGGSYAGYSPSDSGN